MVVGAKLEGLATIACFLPQCDVIKEVYINHTWAAAVILAILAGVLSSEVAVTFTWGRDREIKGSERELGQERTGKGTGNPILPPAIHQC